MQPEQNDTHRRIEVLGQELRKVSVDSGVRYAHTATYLDLHVASINACSTNPIVPPLLAQDGAALVTMAADSVAFTHFWQVGLQQGRIPRDANVARLAFTFDRRALDEYAEILQGCARAIRAGGHEIQQKAAEFVGHIISTFAQPDRPVLGAPPSHLLLNKRSSRIVAVTPQDIGLESSGVTLSTDGKDGGVLLPNANLSSLSAAARRFSVSELPFTFVADGPFSQKVLETVMGLKDPTKTEILSAEQQLTQDRFGVAILSHAESLTLQQFNSLAASLHHSLRPGGKVVVYHAAASLDPQKLSAGEVKVYFERAGLTWDSDADGTCMQPFSLNSGRHFTDLSAAEIRLEIAAQRSAVPMRGKLMQFSKR
jgi:hypothetical protein